MGNMAPFINIAMLAGVAGAAVPVIIHLINKSRYRVQPWGAMLFLESESSKRRRLVNLQQLLLLIIRTLLIAAFVLALARPVLRRAAAMGFGSSRTAVILLDSSYSMGARRGAGDRFEEAKAAALCVIEGLRRGDRAAVAFLGTGERVECPEPDADLERVAARIRRARVGHGRADAARALKSAMERLADSDTLGREVYLITDSQKASWPDSSKVALGEITRALDEARFRPEAFLVEVEGEAENAAVREIAIESPVLGAGRPTPVAVTVSNYGQDARETSVKLAADGEPVGVKTVRIDPGLTETVRFTHVFGEPGSHLLTAEILPDSLAADDHAAMSVSVLDHMPALLVNGDPRGEMLEGECGFLRLALEPMRHTGDLGAAVAGGPPFPEAAEGAVQALSGRGRDLFKVREVAPGELASVDYSLYRAVMLANVPVLPETELARLEEFVSEGGGLFIAPGDMVRPEGYNALFWRAGDGLSPARLAPAEGDGNSPEFPAPVPRGHPVFRFLTEGAGAPRIAVRRRFVVRTEAGPAAPHALAKNNKKKKDEAERPIAGVLMRTEGGGPLLVERAFGNGRVLLSAIPLDDDWSDLPQTAFYVPFVWSVFGYLAGDAFPPRNVSVGEALATWLDPRDDVSEAVMYPPAAAGRPHDARPPVPVEVKRRGSRSSVSYEDTREPGVYRLRIKREREEEALYFVVRVPRDESDLGPLPRADREVIEEQLGTEFFSGREELQRRVSAIRTGSELWRPLLLLAVALACVEVFVAARWRTVRALANKG